MAHHLELIKLEGSEILSVLDDLGKLRITVFKEFPYRYEGSLEYEREYLKIYANSPRSAVFLARFPSNGPLVGASTCLPMSDESEEFQEPFLKSGMPVEDIFYFGESILLPAHRGLGYGKRFFELREAHALSRGTKLTTFCAVDRAIDHPARPTDYRDLHSFWEGQGYRKQPALQATFHWREIGQEQESPHSLTFWTKSWNQ